MTMYLKKLREELSKFSSYEVVRIPKAKNNNTDTLARLATTKDFELLKVVPLEMLNIPVIQKAGEPQAFQVTENDYWMAPLITYLQDRVQLKNKFKARKLRYRATKYVLHEGLLSK